MGQMCRVIPLQPKIRRSLRDELSAGHDNRMVGLLPRCNNVSINRGWAVTRALGRSLPTAGADHAHVVWLDIVTVLHHLRPECLELGSGHQLLNLVGLVYCSK